MNVVPTMDTVSKATSSGATSQPATQYQHMNVVAPPMATSELLENRDSPPHPRDRRTVEEETIQREQRIIDCRMFELACRRRELDMWEANVRVQQAALDEYRKTASIPSTAANAANAEAEAPKPYSIIIRVRDPAPTGQLLAIWILPRTTVLELKRQIEGKAAIQVENQDCIFRGRLMRDEGILRKCGIKDGDVVDCYWKGTYGLECWASGLATV